MTEEEKNAALDAMEASRVINLPAELEVRRLDNGKTVTVKADNFETFEKNAKVLWLGLFIEEHIEYNERFAALMKEMLA